MLPDDKHMFIMLVTLGWAVGFSHFNTHTHTHTRVHKYTQMLKHLRDGSQSLIVTPA